MPRSEAEEFLHWLDTTFDNPKAFTRNGHLIGLSFDCRICSRPAREHRANPAKMSCPDYGYWQKRALAAEARIAAVEKLCDRAEGAVESVRAVGFNPPAARLRCSELRAALAGSVDTPKETTQ